MTRDIDHAVIAEHNGKLPESMRQLKRKFETYGTGLWPIYVKAYLYDQLEQKVDNMKTAGLKAIAQSYDHVAIMQDENEAHHLYTINSKGDAQDWIASDDLIKLAAVLAYYTVTRQLDLSKLEE